MPCDTRLRKNQTISERKTEVLAAVARIVKGLVSGRIRAQVGPQGAVAFSGVTNEERDGVTDACAYRRIMATGSSLAKAQIARAEQLAGRAIDKKVVGHGVHSHDGGRSWHSGH